VSDTLVSAPPTTDDHDDERPPRDTEATLHMCAGVYVDRRFRNLVIRKVHNDARHRVAPSYGFDLVPIVRHAWRSWFFDFAYLLVLLGVLVASLAFAGPLTTVLVWCTAALYLLLRRIFREIPTVLRLQAQAFSERWGFHFAKDNRPAAKGDLSSGKRRLRASYIGLLIVLAIPLVVSLLSGTSISSATGPAFLIASMLVACAIVAGMAHRLLLVALARAETLRPGRLTSRERLIGQQQDHPCVIYERPPHRTGELSPLELVERTDAPSPFLGSGKLVSRWPPFAVQLLRKGEGSLQQREFVTPPFSAYALVVRLRRALQALGSDPGAENLPGLRVSDRVYFAAPDIPVDSELLRDGPDELAIRRIVNDHRLAGDHFLVTSVPIYDGKLIATVLLRVSLKGRSLSLDVATCALTRIPDRFHVVDRYGALGAKALVRSAVRGVLSLPADVFRLWQLLEVPVVLGRAWWARRDRMATPRRRTIRPLVAVREKIADAWRNAEQDHTTISDHVRIVEKRILKATEDFLDEHDVDTSTFEKQATQIINSGVLSMGSSQLNIDQVAQHLAQINNNSAGGA